MNIVSHKKLADFYVQHKDAVTPLEQGYCTARKARCTCFADIKKDFNNVHCIGDQHHVFNIKENDYRLAVIVQFTHGYLYMQNMIK